MKSTPPSRPWLDRHSEWLETGRCLYAELRAALQPVSIDGDTANQETAALGLVGYGEFSRIPTPVPARVRAGQIQSRIIDTRRLIDVADRAAVAASGNPNGIARPSRAWFAAREQQKDIREEPNRLRRELEPLTEERDLAECEAGEQEETAHRGELVSLMKAGLQRAEVAQTFRVWQEQEFELIRGLQGPTMRRYPLARTPGMSPIEWARARSTTPETIREIAELVR